MKKLVNSPHAAVSEMLEGLVAMSPGQALLEGEFVVIRADIPADIHQREVAIISGGGSGHEPAHAGYVGAGMLHAAVAGEVFTSPSVDSILAAIRSVAGPAGALLVVKNYTGDRLNFGLAAELARADGIPTEIVVVADDVSLRDTVPPERRRGLAGTVLVHKVAGAAAASGATLAEIAREGAAAAAALGTMGVALGACTIPAAGRPGFLLGDDEIELGLGIHGEQGVRRVSLQPADGLVDTLLETILEDRGMKRGDRVALLLNGLGGTPQMELAIVARRALAVLREQGLEVQRAWSGEFMTALEMPGCSLTVMKVNDHQLERLDALTGAPAWPGSGRIPPAMQIHRLPAPSPATTTARVEWPGSEPLKRAVLAVAGALEAAEARLTDLDSQAGDGDLGLSLARGAASMRILTESPWESPSRALSAIGEAIRRTIGGSSGPFYAVALIRAARHLGEGSPDASRWAEAFSGATEAIAELGGARAGDRTMLDALFPAAETFAQALEAGQAPRQAWEACVRAAQQGATATASMMPRLGRASYLGERALGIPDAGAMAVVVWLEALTPHIR